MTETVAEYGFPETTVRKVIEGSGISRRTYYRLYSDKEDCYLAPTAKSPRR
jgi:AcrR family transcriptional regulator